MSALLGLSTMLLLAASCVAQESSSTDLARKADEASGNACAKASMKVAQQSLNEAAKLFNNGELKAAHSAVDMSLHYAQHSVDCTLEARRGEKSREIDLRELIRRLNDLRHAVDLDDRPQLSRSISELQKERDRLLSAMFGPSASGVLESNK